MDKIMFRKRIDRIMKEYKIKEFIHKKTETVIYSMTAFVEGNTCLLFNKKSGHMFLTDIECFEMFRSKNISDGLLRKLDNRGFTNKYSANMQPYECEILPEFFMIDLTSNCNMRCKYCLRNVGSDNHFLQLSVLDGICDFINAYAEKYNLKDISIQPWGGEPLLALDLILRLRNKIHPTNTRVHFSIETNGLLLNEQNAQLLYENKIGIGISIDGYKQLHDGQRVTKDGKGTHSVVEKNLINSKNLFGSRLGTITTITKKNASHVEEILDYFVRDLKLEHVKFNFVHDSLFFNCEELCVPEEEISETIIRLLNKIVKLNEEGLTIEEHNISVKLRNILTRRFTDICHSAGCCGGKKMIVFDMNGGIYPCELTDTPGEAIGNIGDGVDLVKVVNSSITIQDYFTPKKEKICDECDWYVFCRGGCTVRAISRGNRPPKIDRIECAVNRSLYPALIELILTKPKIVNKILGCEIL